MNDKFNKYIEHNIEELVEKFNGKNIAITGISGLIGSEILNFFEKLNIFLPNKINIYGITRDIEKCERKIINKNITLCTWKDFPKNIEYIIHGAAPTASREFEEKPVETINNIISYTNICLEKARENQSRIIYLSTIEVYGELKADYAIKESELGYINLKNPRNSYPEAKRLSELIVYSYVTEYNIEAMSVRLTQVMGPIKNDNDTRLVAYLASCVANEKDIIMKTKGKLSRDYIDYEDVITGIVTILMRGKAGQTYNLSNPKNNVSASTLAEMFASQSEKTNVLYNIDEIALKTFAPQIKQTLSIDKLNELGWYPMFSLDESIKRMIKYINNKE